MRLMFRLALRNGHGPVLLKSIARDEEISEKYLSQIIIALKGRGLVHSIRGARGGYMLSRPPSEINLKQVVDALEGTGSINECVATPSVCARAGQCVARDVWAKVDVAISRTLQGMTLADLVVSHERKLKSMLIFEI